MAIPHQHQTSVSGTKYALLRLVLHYLPFRHIQLNLYLQHKPARVVDISFSKPKLEDPGEELLSETPEQRDQTPATLNEQTGFFKGLDQLYPRAVVLTTVFDKKKTEVTAKTQLPPPITSLYHPKYNNMGEKDLKRSAYLCFRA